MGSHRSASLALVVALLLALALALPVGAQETTIRPRIQQILWPLATVPTIVERGEQLQVELDPDLVDLTGTGGLSATLRPSFGAVELAFLLEPVGLELGVDSAVWPQRRVSRATFELDWAEVAEASAGRVDALFDLTVAWPDGSDQQPRAVALTDDFPDDPTFAVIADPSVGDPRPVQEGARDVVTEGSVDPLIHRTAHTIGAGTDGERWAALNRAIDDVNLMDPDVVFVTGDLTFGLHTRGVPYEYEEIYRLVNRLRAPTYVTPGNHDLYTFDTQDSVTVADGWDVWPEMFGPLHYGVDIADDLHLVSINTFDWAQQERLPADRDEGDIRSGGQIRDEQLAWLRDHLSEYRARRPNGAIVTIAHHDPSWMQNRHPWEGVNRLALRDLLADMRIGVHFSGHKHNDRVARYYRGDVVETNGQNDGAIGQLHYVRRDDTIDDSFSQERLGRTLRAPAHGPLFVTTTTAASGLEDEEWGLGGYWGWRFGTLDRQGFSYDPIDFGYPATREFLDANAERPDNWNPDHAQFGLFSYPSYHLQATTSAANDGTEDEVTYDVVNDHLTDVTLLLPVSLATTDGDRIEAEGGRVVQVWSDGDVADASVEVNLAPGASSTVTVSAATSEHPTAHGTTSDDDRASSTSGGTDRDRPLPTTGAAHLSELGLLMLCVASYLRFRASVM